MVKCPKSRVIFDLKKKKKDIKNSITVLKLFGQIKYKSDTYTHLRGENKEREEGREGGKEGKKIELYQILC